MVLLCFVGAGIFLFDVLTWWEDLTPGERAYYRSGDLFCQKTLAPDGASELWCMDRWEAEQP